MPRTRRLLETPSLPRGCSGTAEPQRGNGPGKGTRGVLGWLWCCRDDPTFGQPERAMAAEGAVSDGLAPAHPPVPTSLGRRGTPQHSLHLPRGHGGAHGRSPHGPNLPTASLALKIYNVPLSLCVVKHLIKNTVQATRQHGLGAQWHRGPGAVQLAFSGHAGLRCQSLGTAWSQVHPGGCPWVGERQTCSPLHGTVLVPRALVRRYS